MAYYQNLTSVFIQAKKKQQTTQEALGSDMDEKYF